ncbi:sulfatase-like hydrolase/transferase, partial [Verrucomicrobia bacterium]|nr:sulfatase-like hydrolase/transferase [Verrucomicrobiota bacterium]
MMKIKSVLTVLCSLLICDALHAQSSERPNILFIFLDDFGWKDTSYMGSDFYETPHLDGLAREGMIFTQAYSAAANCAPARASLLSGQYTPRHQVFNVGTRPRGKAKHRRLNHIPGTDTLRTDIQTWAHRIQKAGYADTHGGSAIGFTKFPFSYTYRDYVIGALNDPSNDLREKAVDQWIASGNEALSDNQASTAKVIFRQALQYARDVIQIRALADELEKMEYTVDIPDLLGFITDWKVVGPFHNLDRGGFETVFPPEKELRLDGTFDGKSGEVSWESLSSDDRFGMIDINDAYAGYQKEVTAYAHHAFISDQERPVQLRLGCKNAWKVWLNGELLFGRDEYHRGMKIDQYIMDAGLRAGRNDIVVKICQNEQVEDWT